MDGRETIRRSGSPVQGDDLGGRRRSDGEGQQDEERNPLVSSAAATPSAVEMAEIIMRVIKEAEALRAGEELPIRGVEDCEPREAAFREMESCLLYTSPSPRD